MEVIIFYCCLGGIIWWIYTSVKKEPTYEDTAKELQAIQREIDVLNRPKEEFEERKEKWQLALMLKHGSTLVKHRHNSVSLDRYGVPDLTPMRKEAKYFMKNVYLPAHKKWMEGLSWEEKNWLIEEEQLHKPAFIKLMEGFIVDFTESQYEDPNIQRQIKEAYSKDEECPEDPFEFEAFCSRILERKGWTAKATQGSGDQGADVIGTKGEYKVIIQCKMYSNPVGNKAVQEVIAAKGFFHGTHALVVNSDGEFTKSARELAVMSGVELMHYNELKEWEPRDKDSPILI